jgi:hypothetical protein
MRHPKEEELEPLREALHNIQHKVMEQRRELQPLQDVMEDAMLALQKVCGVPPVVPVNEVTGKWLDKAGEPLKLEDKD